ncbi:MAG: hypothetical protein HY790_02940 [Deltaproteobacteria bacterium]|nr:hypothetical protein [Deltaproteobacteria bacterium]
MGYTIAGLKDKIMEMYPEIDKYGVVSSLIFDNSKKTYVFKLTKGPHELSPYIDQVDADACMGGKECIHLGIRIRQFLENFKEGE